MDQSKLDAVAAAIDKYKGDPSEANESVIRNAMAALSGAETTSLSEFFKSVGDSVVAAQKHLDQQSHDYQLTAPEGAVAGHYHIPKASAEFRFALGKSSQKGFDILIYQDINEQRQEHEQRVSFDVVSAPIPPELRQKIAAKGDALDALLATLKRQFKDRPEIEPFLDRKHLARAIILETTREDISGTAIMLFDSTGQNDWSVLALFAPDRQRDDVQAISCQLDTSELARLLSPTNQVTIQARRLFQLLGSATGPSASP